MRIAYLTSQPFHQQNGVTNKILGQLRAWRGFDHEAKLFVFTRSVAMCPQTDSPYEAIACGNWLARNHRAKRLVHAILNYRPDIVFFRLGAFYSAYQRLFERLPVVIDINTDDLLEYGRTMGPIKHWLYAKGRYKALSLAAGVTTVTPELLQREQNLSCPTQVVSNGIDFGQYPVVPCIGSSTPRIVFLGSQGRRWHGVENLMRIARRIPEIDFDIVGYANDESALALPQNVQMHGFMSPINYRTILAGASAAISSLGLHRNQLKEGCPLKVREYLASGLPTIHGYHDVDLSAHDEFSCQLDMAAGASPSQCEQIRRFVSRWKDRRVSREQITHLDLSIKETQRLDFFQQVA